MNCAKSCSNFRTQKEQNKEQGSVWFFCANFLFVLKEQNRTSMPTPSRHVGATRASRRRPRGLAWPRVALPHVAVHHVSSAIRAEK